MKNTIEYIQIEEKEKVLSTLVMAVEYALHSAFQRVTKSSASTLSSRIEKTSLQKILGSPPTSMCFMETQFHKGLQGKTLFAVRWDSLAELGNLLSEGKADGGEVMNTESSTEACVHFFNRVMEESNKNFSDLYFQVASENLSLINVEGKSEELKSLEDCYQNVLCTTYHLSAETKLDLQIFMLVQSGLLQSLMELLPDHVVEQHEYAITESQGVIDGEAAKGKAKTADSVSGSSFPSTGDRPQGVSGNWNIDLLLDVELPISVAFGESEMQLKEVLKLGVGSVIELNKSVNDPVTVIVNHKPIAKGEVVMVEGNYGVRILEVESTVERIRSLG